jgi:sarcosine oxidase subunit beta
MADYEAAVIGAGVHGASAAYHLARRGLRTLLLERGHPADGPTTGRSSAICRAFYTNAFLAHVAQESLEIFMDFDARVGGPAGFRRTGALFLHPASEAAHVRDTAADLAARGVDIRTLAPDQLAEDFPGIDRRDVAVAVWEPGAGYADPVLTTTSYVDAMRAQGGDVAIKSEVLRVEPGDPVRLTTRQRQITADRVLVAAGPWTRALLAPAGVAIATHAERHPVATVRGGAAVVPFIVADTVTGWYGKPDVGHRYVLGGLAPEAEVDPDSADDRITDDELMDYAARLVARFPAAAECGPAGGWAGVYDVSADWQPIIGEVAPNVVVDCGSSGHGFKLAPVLGRYVADLVAGDDVAELREFDPNRFARGADLPAGFGTARILG